MHELTVVCSQIHRRIADQQGGGHGIGLAAVAAAAAADAYSAVMSVGRDEV